MLKIYNTLTRTKEEFKPQNPPEVKMYTCGVTVYDDCHIGHARSLYIFELIRRYLVYKSLRVRFIRNITDVDDKIINRAREWSKRDNISLKTAFDKVRDHYIKRYYQDLKALDLPKADNEPLATENIPDMIKFIEGLIDKGFAYQKKGNVYFRIRKFSDYGKLSGKKINDLFYGVRIEPDSLKEDPLDFALWKEKKEDEPFWSSPFGEGRPGWHIECSVMSQKHLKTDTLDIHGGGKDLVFPHHENEIAQSESLTGKKFVHYWIHHGLLTINGQKMAKSLGNFVTIKDFVDKYKDEDLLKLFYLSTHYSHPIDYNEEKIKEARKQKKSLYDFFDRVNLRLLRKGRSNLPTSKKDKAKIESICVKFQEAMDDDFNTPQALACLFELIDTGSGFASSDKEEAFNYAKSRLEIFFAIFGLKIKPKEEIPKEFKEMAKKRDQAREKKDFKKADEIRSQIESNNYLKRRKKRIRGYRKCVHAL